jgi:hypothetical protein
VYSTLCEKKIPPTLPGAPAEREERTTTRWEVTCLPLLHSEQSGVNLLSHDRTVSRKVVRPWEQSIVRNDIEYPSPPRGVAMHDISELNPAGCVDKKENENRYGPLANETDDSPAAKVARLKPILADMARGGHTALSEPCEESVCVDREVSEMPSTEDDPAPPASQISPPPPARGENETAVSSGLPDRANGEEEKSGGAGEDDKQDSETSLSSPSRQTTSTAQLLTETQSEKAECTAAFSTEPGSTAAATDVNMRFEWGDMSGESVIDGHRGSVRLRVHSVANLWVRLSGARLLYQRLRVIQGGMVGPTRENNTYNEAGINTGFERGTLNFFQITTMKLRTTPIRIVIRVRCSCPFNSLRVVTVNAKTLAALSHVVSSCLAPNQLQFHNHIVIAHGAECMYGITPSIKYQSNYKSRHSSSPNTALELKNEHPFEGNGRRYELPIRISLVALVQTCSVYTCRLEFAKEDDPKLKYMLKPLTAEYDPTDRRSPKRKDRDDENGADTLDASIHSLTYMNLCYRAGPSCTGTDGSFGSSSDYLNSLIRVLALGEPLFAQLGNLYEHQSRLKRTPLTRGTTIESKHLFAETVSKGEHLFAETEIKGEHLFAETEIRSEHLFAETGIKGEHLFAETESKGEHLFAETEIKGEHLFAETEIKGEHLFAETEIKGEHLFAETEIKGEHLFAETESKGEHLLAEIKNKGEHLLAEIKNMNWKQEREPVKTKRAGW